MARTEPNNSKSECRISRIKPGVKILLCQCNIGKPSEIWPFKNSLKIACEEFCIFWTWFIIFCIQMWEKILVPFLPIPTIALWKLDCKNCTEMHLEILLVLIAIIFFNSCFEKENYFSNYSFKLSWLLELLFFSVGHFSHSSSHTVISLKKQAAGQTHPRTACCRKGTVLLA